MAYEKQTWQSGDVVTSSKLNHIEDGIDDAHDSLTVTATYDSDGETYSFDKKFGDLREAYENHIPIRIHCLIENEYENTMLDAYVTSMKIAITYYDGSISAVSAEFGTPIPEFTTIYVAEIPEDFDGTISELDDCDLVC